MDKGKHHQVSMAHSAESFAAQLEKARAKLRLALVETQLELANLDFWGSLDPRHKEAALPSASEETTRHAELVEYAAMRRVCRAASVVMTGLQGTDLPPQDRVRLVILRDRIEELNALHPEWEGNAHAS